MLFPSEMALKDERFKHWIRKNPALLQYVIIDLRRQCCQYGRGRFNVTRGRLKARKRSPDQCIKLLMPPSPVAPLTILKISLSGDWSFQ